MATSGIDSRALLYADSRGYEILPFPIGSGTDGSVWKTNCRTAVKVFHASANYLCELECYKRFLRANVTEIFEYHVPRLVDYDNAHMVIEMDIVETPYILDFGKVYLDRAPDYSPEVLAEWKQELQALWGRHYPIIRKILWNLEQYGIYYIDPKPGNIMPDDWEAE